MRCRPHVPEQVKRLCSMSREITTAVRRVMLRIDLMERNGRSELNYLRHIEEVKVWASVPTLTYLVSPSESLVASFISFKMEDDLITDVLIHDVFLFDQMADLEQTVSRQ